MGPWAGDVEILWRIPLTALAVYTTIIVLTRTNGLRSFSTMSGFDFAITVASGSLVATTVLSPDVPLAAGVLALAVLFVLQRLTATLRRSTRLSRWVDNEPVLLVRRGEMLRTNMDIVRLTPDDVRAKLRQAGVLHLEEVEAVVLETTGDVSVIRRRGEAEMDDALLQGVKDIARR